MTHNFLMMPKSIANNEALMPHQKFVFSTIFTAEHLIQSKGQKHGVRDAKQIGKVLDITHPKIRAAVNLFLDDEMVIDDEYLRVDPDYYEELKTEGFIKIPMSVVSDPQYTWQEKIIICTAGNFQRMEKGVCFASQKTIGKATNRGSAAVSRALNKAKRLGVAIINVKPAINGIKYQTNRVRILFDRFIGEVKDLIKAILPKDSEPWKSKKYVDWCYSMT